MSEKPTKDLADWLHAIEDDNPCAEYAHAAAARLEDLERERDEFGALYAKAIERLGTVAGERDEAYLRRDVAYEQRDIALRNNDKARAEVERLKNPGGDDEWTLMEAADD